MLRQHMCVCCGAAWGCVAEGGDGSHTAREDHGGSGLTVRSRRAPGRDGPLRHSACEQNNNELTSIYVCRWYANRVWAEQQRPSPCVVFAAKVPAVYTVHDECTVSCCCIHRNVFLPFGIRPESKHTHTRTRTCTHTHTYPCTHAIPFSGL